MVEVYAGTQWEVVKQGEIIFHKPNEFHAIRSIGVESPNLVVASFTSKSESMYFFEGKHYELNPEEKMILAKFVSEARNTFSTPLHIPSIEQVVVRGDAIFGAEQTILMFLEYFLIINIRNHGKNNREERRHKEEIFDFQSLPGMGTTKKNSWLPDKVSFVKEKNKKELYLQAIRYMEFHVSEKLTVQEICKKFGVSKSFLQAMFHEENQCGAIEYFNRIKIMRAKEMIRAGNKNLTEIAIFLSYSSLAYFSKCFKQAEKMAPLTYAHSVKNISGALDKNN